MIDATEFKRDRGVLPVAVFLIAATFGYHLVFAETAFMGLAASKLEGTRQLSFLRSVLGICGLVGGLLAGWRFRLERYPRALSNALRACAVVAVVALVAQTWEFLVFTAALAGLALGWLMVTLVAGLRACVGTPKLGLCIGAGIGLAHALSMLPWVTAAEPTIQVVIATVVIGVAAVVTPWMLPQEPSTARLPDYQPGAVAAWIAVFLALVWIESAAFAMLPRPVGADAFLNVGPALVAALLAGVAIDRGWFGRVALIAFGLLGAACLLLPETSPYPGGAGLLHAAGAGFSMTALVHFLARGGRAWLAALVFGISLWLGSTMGVGMAEELNRVPWTFVLGAGIVVCVGLGWRQQQRSVLPRA